MSELIQEPKYITVQEFMPEWTTWMEKAVSEHLKYSQRPPHLDIVDGSRCMVGEVHGFKGEYGWRADLSVNGYCHECTSESCYSAISAESSALMYGDLKPFYTLKEKLYNHFMESHNEMLLRK